MKPTALQDIRRLYNMYNVLGLRSRQRLIVCPLPFHSHYNRSPSFSIFVTPDHIQKFKCHGNCGKEGDVIDLVGYMKIPGYDPRDKNDVKEAASLLTGSLKIDPPEVATTKVPELNNNAWRKYIPIQDNAVEYLRSREIGRAAIEYFRIGSLRTISTTWVTMPTFHDERLRGIKLRNITAKQRHERFSSIPGGVEGLFNFNVVNETTEPVLIVKAELSVINLWQYNILSCAPTGGEGSYVHHQSLAGSLAFSRKRIVVGDNDPDVKVSEKTKGQAKKRAEIFNAKLMFPPERYKDLDDWIKADKQAIPQIREWLR